MKAPPRAALAVLVVATTTLYFERATAVSDNHGISKAKYREACPAYEHYAKFAQ